MNESSVNTLNEFVKNPLDISPTLLTSKNKTPETQEPCCF